MRRSEPKWEESEEGILHVNFGPLTCNLATKTFGLFIVSVDDRDFIEWNGDFVRRDGKWIAEVTGKSRT